LVGAQFGGSAAAGDHLRQALGLFIGEYGIHIHAYSVYLSMK